MDDADETYFSLGSVLAGGQLELTAPRAARAHAVCSADSRFRIVECRQLSAERPGDAIVVDCKNPGVPTKNSRGIRYVERLALVFWQQPNSMPEVWGLRRDFPATEHQNAVARGCPPCLCLYFEPWTTVARTWTARKHLERIVRWLADVAAGELHRADQPVEQFYYAAPWELVLPPEVRVSGLPADKVLAVHKINPQVGQKGLLLSSVMSRGQATSSTPVSAITCTVPAIVGGQIERPVATLGELADQLDRRGSSLIRPLVDELHKLTDVGGIEATPGELGLILVRVPIRRHAEGDVEQHQVHGFLVTDGLGPVGERLNQLRFEGDRYFRVVEIFGDLYSVGNAWRATPIEPVAIIDGLSLERTMYLTGVDRDSAQFKAVLIGAGSLGGQLAEIWGREAWGEWTVIDDDLIKPHNVPRHRALYRYVGGHKAQVVAAMISEAFPVGMRRAASIVKDATVADDDVRRALLGADLIVDVSTTLHVPRDLSRQPDLPRLASLFLAPSGHSSVMLVEDSSRSIPLDALESQYYRAIIRSAWGATHLSGHRANELWVGAGCREVTTVLAPDLVALHAGTLARRLRLQRDRESAYIGVWNHHESTGALTAENVTTSTPIASNRGDWSIRWDADIQGTVRSYREQALPQETGGALVGYIDQVLKAIFIVDALRAPADSVAHEGSFARGIDGLRSDVEAISELTAGIVGYIGEWHSHPDGHSVQPSRDDLTQVCFLAEHLRQDGHPALMLIIGQHREAFVLGEIDE